MFSSPCTHRVQPLDVNFFGPLSTYYNQKLNKWLKLHLGRIITHYQDGELFKNAYGKAATISNIENGFLKTGIYPFNPDIFSDWMFAPSTVTDIRNPKEEENEKQMENENSQKKILLLLVLLIFHLLK